MAAGGIAPTCGSPASPGSSNQVTAARGRADRHRRRARDRGRGRDRADVRIAGVAQGLEPGGHGRDRWRAPDRRHRPKARSGDRRPGPRGPASMASLTAGTAPPSGPSASPGARPGDRRPGGIDVELHGRGRADRHRSSRPVRFDGSPRRPSASRRLSRPTRRGSGSGDASPPSPQHHQHRRDRPGHGERDGKVRHQVERQIRHRGLAAQRACRLSLPRQALRVRIGAKG